MSESLRSNETTRQHAAWPATALRGCQVCDYGRASDGQTCTHAEARGNQPTLEQRRRGSACGPEAKFLTIKGVEL